MGAVRDPLAPTQRRGLDATTLLSAYVLLLIALPSKLIFAPLGGAGTPAQVVGLAGGFWCLWWRLNRPEQESTGEQPVRFAMATLALAVLCSYVAAMIRPINDTETSSADLGLVALAGWVGIVLLANDGIVSLSRLLILLRRLAAAGGFIATVGLAQFVTGDALVEYITLPGLSVNQALTGLGSREGFFRPAGTAVHPIEFGVVLTAILPIAVVCAIYLKDHSWVRRWYPVFAISLAIPLSISRTAIVGSVICLAVLMPAFSKRTRVLTLASVGALFVALFFALPGFLGTITGLFTTIGNDSSALSRTGSYGIAMEFVQGAPVFGRGFSTFLPSYWILDNQYLGLLIEVGVVGLSAMLWLIVCAFRSAIRSRRLSTDPIVRAVAQGLAASVAGLAVCTALYDLLSFPMSAGILFLVIGLCGALWRLVRQDERVDSRA